MNNLHDEDGDELCNTNNTKNNNSVDEEEDLWDQAVADLLRDGVATVNLSRETAATHGQSFSVIRHALHVLSSQSSKNSSSSSSDDDTTTNNNIYIPSDADATHATGYHKVGGLSARYNAHREGFVVSNNQYEKFGQHHHHHDLRLSLKGLSESMHRMAKSVLCAMERQLDLPVGYFEDSLGPFPTSSQFHVKRYVEEDGRKNTTASHTDNDTKAAPQKILLLPMHTDPSLISVVVHDVPGRNPGCMGLQYYSHHHDHHHHHAPPSASVEDDATTTSTPRGSRSSGVGGEWREVSSHGHAVAVLFVGSVFSHMTGGTVPAAKHRVITSSSGAVVVGQQPPPTIRTTSRVAATLFVRPQLDAKLSILPSPKLQSIRPSSSAGTTFQEWISRVSKKYSQGRRLHRRPARETTPTMTKFEEDKDDAES